ncbi:hypothetical protein, partial [uncultured Muribaculum sp.]|uniref:hypothetical protein n=1 Tax=uncultured Muribaculum sp. TaxID=1918613 RepID=UPI0026EDC5EE
GRRPSSDFCLVMKERSRSHVTEEHGKKRRRNAMQWHLKFFIFFFFVEEVTPRAIVMHLRPLVSVTMQPHCSLTARTHLHNA